MEVVLQQDYPSLGYVGDRVRVKGGFARNYLIPRGLALELTSRNAKVLRHKLTQVAAKKAKFKNLALERAKKFEGLILEFHLRIGEKGKSFGAISIKDIEQSLRDKGLELERKQIRLLETIKAGGEYPVEVKLHSEVIVPITARVIVERIEKKVEAVEGEEKGKKRSPRKARGKKDEAAPSEGEGEVVQEASTEEA